MHNHASTNSHVNESVSTDIHNQEAIEQQSHKEFCFTLNSTLQNSLELKETLLHFYQMLRKAVHCSGISYHHKAMSTELIFGTRRAHKANYKLKIEHTDLGEIVFYGVKRFAESQLLTIETLLGILVPPLRNALLYKDALDKSLLDPLTQVGNRASMDQALKRELILAKRNEQPLSILMVDLDHFKLINDTNGHQVGDKVLSNVALSIKQVLRETDQVFRYGGEEFIVVLGNTSHFDALIIADRMRQSVEQGDLNDSPVKINATVSIGVSTVQDCKNQDLLIEQADRALYQAKAKGRNRVESARTLRGELSSHAIAQQA